MKTLLTQAILFITIAVANAQTPAEPTLASTRATLNGAFNVSTKHKCLINLNGQKIHSTEVGGLSASSPLEIKEGDRLTIRLESNAEPDKRDFTLCFISADGKTISFKKADYRVIPAIEPTDFDPDPTKMRNWKQVDVNRKIKNPFPFPNSSDSVWGQGKISYLACVITRDHLNSAR